MNTKQENSHSDLSFILDVILSCKTLEQLYACKKWALSKSNGSITIPMAILEMLKRFRITRKIDRD